MDQSLSSETDTFSASQEIPYILGNLKVQYHVQKGPTTHSHPEPDESSPFPPFVFP